MNMIMPLVLWKKWRLMKKEFFTALSQFSYLMLKGKCCCKNVQKINITAAAYGQTHVAAILYQEKKLKMLRAEDCMKKWGSIFSLNSLINLFIKPIWIKISLNMNTTMFLPECLTVHRL